MIRHEVWEGATDGTQNEEVNGLTLTMAVPTDIRVSFEDPMPRSHRHRYAFGFRDCDFDRASDAARSPKATLLCGPFLNKTRCIKSLKGGSCAKYVVSDQALDDRFKYRKDLITASQ